MNEENRTAMLKKLAIQGVLNGGGEIVDLGSAPQELEKVFLRLLELKNHWVNKTSELLQEGLPAIEVELADDKAKVYASLLEFICCEYLR